MFETTRGPINWNIYPGLVLF